ncbi:MAG TPA: FHA domain-containing protein [Streptosporangiaceae bacterium]|nr:FHA domain-containing protein [Streptosporangiaceae bacterium]
MARCQTGHETANTDFCDICGARVIGTPGFGLERGGGKHRGADRSPVSDGRICPGCGAPAPGPFCDACGLRLRGHGAFGTFGAPEEEYPPARASSAPPESLFPPVTRPGASSSPWGPAEPPSPWNSPPQQAPPQQAWAQQAPAESPSSWSQATQAQAEPPAPWNLPADQSAPWNTTTERPAPWNSPADQPGPWNTTTERPAPGNTTAEPAAPWNTPAERPAAWAPPPQAPQAPPAESRPPAPPASSGDAGALSLLESLFSPEQPAAPVSAPSAGPAAPPASMPSPAAPAPAQAPPVVSAAPPTRPIPALAAAWTVLVASDRAYYDMMKSVRDQRGPDVAFPAVPGQRRIRLTGHQMRIGRRSATRELKPEIDLAEQPVDPGVSRLHAVLIATSDGNWSILDPGSANGTLLNGREIPAGEQIPLQEGDRINLGAWTVISMHRS